MAKIYSEEIHREGQTIEFTHKQSFESVTSCVEIKTSGNMTLIDTPGFNDPKSQMSDKKILNEMTKLVRPIVS